MSKIIHFFQLRMLPAGVDFGLLIARLGFGLSLLLLHGWTKVTGFSTMAPEFADPWGLGGSATLALAVFAEVGCAALVAVGLFTRFASLVCAINMGSAFFYGHGGRLTGEQNGELAFLYLLAFVAIFFTGSGRFGADHWIGNAVKRSP